MSSAVDRCEQRSSPPLLPAESLSDPVTSQDTSGLEALLPPPPSEITSAEDHPRSPNQELLEEELEGDGDEELAEDSDKAPSYWDAAAMAPLNTASAVSI